MVYGAQSQDDFPILVQMNLAIIGDWFIWPDLVIILDVSPATAVERLKSKGRDLDGHEKLEKLEKVRQLYIQFANHYPNCQVVSADGPQERILESVKEKIKVLMVRKGWLKE